MNDYVLPVSILAVGLALIGLAMMLSDSLPLPYPKHIRADSIRGWNKDDATRAKGIQAKETVPKTVVFLDVDGTITRLPGQHPDSLFSKAEYYENAKFTDEIMSTLYEDKQKYGIVKEFLHQLQNDPECEPVIVSLNHRSVIKHILEDHFGCDAGVFLKKGFTRDDAFGSPREMRGVGRDVNLTLASPPRSGSPVQNGLGFSSRVSLNSSRAALLMTKGQFIKQFMTSSISAADNVGIEEAREQGGTVNFTFFDDDVENLRSVEHLKISLRDCSNGMWLGRMMGTF